MVNQKLPEDFREFLRLLKEHKVKYLLISGYAVGYYGHPRTTADMDIWIAVDDDNTKKVKDTFSDFGMISPEITPALFQQPGNIVRMGLPPMRSDQTHVCPI